MPMLTMRALECETLALACFKEPRAYRNFINLDLLPSFLLDGGFRVAAATVCPREEFWYQKLVSCERLVKPPCCGTVPKHA